MFGLLGPNGAGKSSLMRSIAGLQKVDSGSMLFNGQDIIISPELIRKDLGYLPQEFGVYPQISAYRLLDHLAVLKGILNSSLRKEQILFLLEQTNLYAHRNKAVHTFSGGMKQRFGIAQALLGSPKIIIADEPTAGLDPEERNRFNTLLCEIGEQVIVILSTHIVEDVKDLCSQMAIIASGRVLLSGSPATLTSQLDGKIWAKTIGRQELDQIKSEYCLISSGLQSGKLKVHIYSDSEAGNGFKQTAAGLDDVYFNALRAETVKEDSYA
jgi:ABC-type multidrug transport system ATPase subunit